MMSHIPINLQNVDLKDIDMQILRTGIIAELDAVNLYDQMASITKDKNIKAILHDISKEEKTHIGEFFALLLNRDEEQRRELNNGKEEVKREVNE